MCGGVGSVCFWCQKVIIIVMREVPEFLWHGRHGTCDGIARPLQAIQHRPDDEANASVRLVHAVVLVESLLDIGRSQALPTLLEADEQGDHAVH